MPYADDAIIYTHIKNPHTVKNTFCQILNKFKKWGLQSGAVLSIPKCKILHICKKKNCNFPQIIFDNNIIERVNCLKILGVYFDKNFTFRDQCINLRRQLLSRLNIIKYLSCMHSFIHTNTLVNVTRALILSKIDYALPIFGWCANSNIKLLEAPYHAAVRRSINAFPTSPILCILGESGFPAIKERVYESTMQLIPKLFNSTNRDIHKNLVAASRHKRSFKLNSTLRRCVAYAKNLGILPPKSCPLINNLPVWLLKDNTIDTSLHNLKKSNTSILVYQQRFLELINKYKSLNYTAIYTDGSKRNNTSFAVVTEHGKTISGGILPGYSSVFTAETFAIYKAIEYAIKNKGRFIVCSDSFSCLKAVRNVYNFTTAVSQIRDMCIKYSNKIKLLWVPGHSGITGNEFADHAASYFEAAPTFQFATLDKKDLKKHIELHIISKWDIEWRSFFHKYKSTNPDRSKVVYPRKTTRHQSTIFTRLRIGHTNVTHQHLLTGGPPGSCPFCSRLASAEHFLNECLILERLRKKHFGSANPASILKYVTSRNILSIYNFIQESNLSI